MKRDFSEKRFHKLTPKYDANWCIFTWREIVCDDVCWDISCEHHFKPSQREVPKLPIVQHCVLRRKRVNFYTMWKIGKLSLMIYGMTHVCHNPRQYYLNLLRSNHRFWFETAVLSCHRSKTRLWTYKFECREETCQTSWDRWRWCGWPGCTTRSCPCRSRDPPALKERLSLCMFWDCRWKCWAPKDLWWIQGSWAPSQDPWSLDLTCAIIYLVTILCVKISFTSMTLQILASHWVSSPSTRRWSMLRMWCCKSRHWSSAPRRCRCWCRCCSPGRCKEARTWSNHSGGKWIWSCRRCTWSHACRGREEIKWWAPPQALGSWHQVLVLGESFCNFNDTKIPMPS